jgi:hypothetical protein
VLAGNACFLALQVCEKVLSLLCLSNEDWVSSERKVILTTRVETQNNVKPRVGVSYCAGNRLGQNFGLAFLDFRFVQ